MKRTPLKSPLENGGKRKFKETKLFGILKAAGEIALDILPIPDVRKYLDKDNNGKVSLKEVRWMELAVAIASCAFLIYFDIVSPEQIITIVKTLLNP